MPSSTEPSLFQGRIIEGEELQDEHSQRSRQNGYFLSISNKHPVPEGFRVIKELRTRNHVLKDKNPGMSWEDEVWCSLYRLGATQMNAGAGRRLENSSDLILRLSNGRKHQVDVLAVEGMNVFCVECKSLKSGRKSTTIEETIAKLAGRRHMIEEAMKQVLGRKQLRFIFVIAALNHAITQQDYADARAADIDLWSNHDLESLNGMLDLAGDAAKYQVYGRVFAGKVAPGPYCRVPAIEGSMGSELCYSFMAPPEALLRIAYVHRRSHRASYMELKNSYQRVLTPRRMGEVRRFVEDGGYFPGAIIINFDRSPSLDPVPGEFGRGGRPVALTLPKEYSSAWIIDGQHRLFAYANLPEHRKNDLVHVMAFVGLSRDQQTKMFVDINQNQKRVDSDLLWDLYEDLYEDSDDDSPERALWAMSMIAKRLDSDERSPFFNRIAIPSGNTDRVIGIRAVCDELKRLKLIDESSGTTRLHKDNYTETVDYAADRIAAYFDVLRRAMPEAWDAETEHFLCTPAGFKILVGILQDLLDGQLISLDEKRTIKAYTRRCEELLEPIVEFFETEATDDDVGRFRGTGGAGQASAEVRMMLTERIRDRFGGRYQWLERQEANRAQKRFSTENQLEKYLNREESNVLEFKGSVSLDLDHYFNTGERRHYALKDEEKIDLAEKGVLKSIVGMLNSTGGEIVLGVVEGIRYRGVETEWIDRVARKGDYLIPGIELEFDERGWDRWESKLVDLISKRIDKFVVSTGNVKIRRLPRYSGHETALVSVVPQQSRKSYLDGSTYYVRQGGKTIPLDPQEADKHFETRRRG